MERNGRRPIIIATDLTAASEAAVSFGANLASDLALPVILLHAAAPVSPMSDPIAGVPVTIEPRRETEAAGLELERIIRELFPAHLEVEPRLVNDHPIPAICKLAEDEDAELIVMGRRSHPKPLSFLLGVVVQGVLYRAVRPVITVPSTGDWLDDEIGSILCPVDFNPIARKALIYAASVAQRIGAEMTVAYLGGSGEPLTAGDTARRLSDWVPRDLHARCLQQVVVSDGSPIKELDRMMDGLGFDLLVIGLTGKPFHKTTIIGSSIERILRHASCPVMVVPDSMAERVAASSPGLLAAGVTGELI
ncbi:MAG TPA: universal stress protein [Thermoanaerobaculia bacterium]|nr:universal stress protein [Thermoanaerobaculia bacterium]